MARGVSEQDRFEVFMGSMFPNLTPRMIRKCWNEIENDNSSLLNILLDAMSLLSLNRKRKVIVRKPRKREKGTVK